MYRVMAEFVKKKDIFSCYFHIVIDIYNLKIRCYRSFLYLQFTRQMLVEMFILFRKKKK